MRKFKLASQKKSQSEVAYCDLCKKQGGIFKKCSTCPQEYHALCAWFQGCHFQQSKSEENSCLKDDFAPIKIQSREMFQPLSGQDWGYTNDPMLSTDAVAETFFDDEYCVPSDSSESSSVTSDTH